MLLVVEEKLISYVIKLASLSLRWNLSSLICNELDLASYGVSAESAMWEVSIDALTYYCTHEYFLRQRNTFQGQTDEQQILKITTFYLKPYSSCQNIYVSPTQEFSFMKTAFLRIYFKSRSNLATAPKFKHDLDISINLCMWRRVCDFIFRWFFADSEKYGAYDTI